MPGRGDQRDENFDDWFVEPESSVRRTGRSAGGAATDEGSAAGADDWLAGASASGRVPRYGSRLAAIDKVWFVVAALAVVLLAGLAATGVFSSGHRTAPPATVATTTRTSSTTTAATTARTFVTLPTSTLKPGDTGAQVTDLQRTLASLGYSVGAADGNYGPATQQAVASFQKKSGLTADGVFGAKTLNALNRSAGP